MLGVPARRGQALDGTRRSGFIRPLLALQRARSSVCDVMSLVTGRSPRTSVGPSSPDEDVRQWRAVGPHGGLAVAMVHDRVGRLAGECDCPDAKEVPCASTPSP